LSRVRNVVAMKPMQASFDPSHAIAEQAWSLQAAIVDACQDAIIGNDLTGTITSWNPAASRMFGYSPEEMLGKSILLLIPEESRHEEEAILRDVRAGKRIESYETVRVAKNGMRKDISLTISPIRDGAGRIIGTSKVAQDISDRRPNEEALRRLASIVDCSDDAIVSKNLDGIVTTWNKSARRMFGYEPHEMIGESILRIIPPELHAEEEEILRQLRAGQRIDHFETTRVAKDGTRVEVSLTISPLLDSRGRVIGTSKIARDISNRKKMERVLLQSEKIAATGRMAATIAHEINNPLEAVMNLIFLARQSCAPESDTLGYLRTAENELERVSRIARATLGYYRDPGTPTDEYLHELVESVLQVCGPRLSARGIAIEREFGHTRPIRVRKGEILQVLSNVFANSIDSMAKGGLLRIRVAEAESEAGKGVQVAVEDSGTGIEDRHLARIFEPFFTTKPEIGTGIGLWVTKRLVEGHRGQIRVTSCTSPGRSGTKVAIDIPY
jgi:PAS domain S-box-containing protein